VVSGETPSFGSATVKLHLNYYF